MGDDDRDAILKRRNRLIAIAMAGLASAAGCDDPGPAQPDPPPLVEEPISCLQPMPCLEPAVPDPPPQVDPDPEPMACLSEAMPDPEPVPVPCLSRAVVREPPPWPCLQPPRPRNEPGEKS
ncbi:MAG: hypothetical protein IT378_17110 [Sandaracinaceae bacterium]|nr:hypothetical protein [Sandaracinaceae bacterium]